MKTKVLLIAVTLLLTAQTVFAQLDRSKLPQAGPAREVKIGDYKSFQLKNGLKVFVIENNKLPRVSFNLVLDRLPLKEGEKTGYLSMVGGLMRRGTTSRTKEQIDEEVDFIGASLGAGSSTVFASGLSKYKEQVIELMADITLNPSFPADELEKIKTQAISGLATQKDNPDAISGNVSSVLLYGKDHPYGELQTEESTGKITVEDIKNYHATYFKPNIAYLAIVGDISKKNAEKLVKKYFGKWKKGEISTPSYQTPKGPDKTTVALVDRSASVQSVIDITYPVNLKPGEEDVIPARIMNNILGGGGSARLFTNLREDKGYTYGAYSSLGSDRLVGSFSAGASVRNEVTDSAVYEFMKELNLIKTELVSDDELSLAINSVSGSFSRSLESPQTVANFALNIERFGLPKDYYATYLQKVQAVTKEDVLAIAKKYVRPENAYITVVGKGAEIAEKLGKFGEVKYFDIYGNEYEPSDDAIPAGLTAQKVLDNYVKAIGGESKIAQVKSIQTDMEASIQGQALKITRMKKSADKVLVTVAVGGNTMLEQKFDGTAYSMKQLGNPLPIDEDTKLGMKLEANVIPELAYGALGLEAKLVGAENIEGKNAYAVEVVYPGGTKVKSLYDAESGLKVREDRIVKGPQGEVILSTDFSEYKEVDGVLFPHQMKIPIQPGFSVPAKVSAIKVNEELSDSLFK